MKYNRFFFLIVLSLALPACQAVQPLAPTAVVNQATASLVQATEKPVMVTNTPVPTAAPPTIAPPTTVQPTATKTAPTSTKAPQPTPTWVSKVYAVPCQQGCEWKISDQPDLYAGPGDIAVDRQGNIIVADGGNSHILKLDPNGKLVAKWGSFGLGDGQFLNTLFVATDSEGNVYVSDNSSFRVQKFDPNGKFLMKFGYYGKDEGQFRGPAGLVIDEKGYIYVGDGSDPSKEEWRVMKFDASGKYLGIFGNPVTTPFKGVPSLVFDKQGNLFVDDYGNSRIVKLDSKGVPLSTTRWCGKPDETTASMVPYANVIDTNGNQFVLDINTARICKFGPDGQFLSIWGASGTKENEFSAPSGIEIDVHGNLYILDGSKTGEINGRIRKFVKP